MLVYDSLAEANGELWLSTAFKDFIMDKERVNGIIVERDGQELKIEAKKGVVLSSGGFSHNQTLRESIYQVQRKLHGLLHQKGKQVTSLNPA